MTRRVVWPPVIRLVSIAVVLFIVCCGTFAQEAARPERGATLNRNYLASDIENVNLQNGNVNLSIVRGI